MVTCQCEKSKQFGGETRNCEYRINKMTLDVMATIEGEKLERKLNIIYRRNSTLSHAAEAFLKIAKEFGKTLTD